jgi:hypothetical protein
MFLGLGDDVVTVVTGSTGAPGPAGSLASDQQVYFSAKLLEVAVLMTVLDQFGKFLIAKPKSLLNTLETLS